MASSSSSTPSSQSPKKYDAFISFRGEDTRYNFTSHLHEALGRNHIETYIDYRLEKGDEVWPSLEKGIEDSTLCLVIFSEKCAYSSWCLKELTEILECSKNEGHLVESLLYKGSNDDVRFIRPLGMGGVGKTTLANASFKKFHSACEWPCYLNNVREESKKYGIAALKEKFILELLGDKESQIDMECSNFTSFSYEVLRRSLIEAYLDCIFKKADEVWPSLKKAIEDSTRSVVISSKKYASSSWCLEELTEIFKGKSINKQQLQKWRESESITHSAKANIPCWDLGHGWYRENKLLQKATKGHGCDEGDIGKITLAKALLKQWVVAGADDMFIRVYNYNTMDKVKAVEAQTAYIRLENPLNYGLERVWAIGYMEGSRRVVIGYDEGTAMVGHTNW